MIRGSSGVAHIKTITDIPVGRLLPNNIQLADMKLTKVSICWKTESSDSNGRARLNVGTGYSTILPYYERKERGTRGTTGNAGYLRACGSLVFRSSFKTLAVSRCVVPKLRWYTNFERQSFLFLENAT